MFRQVLLLAGTLLLYSTPLFAQSNRHIGRVPLALLGARADTMLTGEQIYRSSCAACHGPDGAGAPTELIVFETPVPDLSDCNFASGKVDIDWFAVIHDGGPARGFSRMMPAFGDALTDEKIQRTIDYIRTFCGDPKWPRGELNLPRPQVTDQAFPDDEAIYTTIPSLEKPFEWDHFLEYDKRFGALNLWVVSVPYTVKRDENGWTGGLGDVAVALKRVMYHSLDRGAIITANLAASLPTGDEDDGIGSGTVIVEPSVSVGKLLTAAAFLQLQFGADIPFDRARATEEPFWRGVIGGTFMENRWGRAWSPMLELLGSRELASGEGIKWSVLPQLAVSLSKRQHVVGNVGVRVPFKHAEENRWQLWFYLLWDTFEGPFFAGW